MRISRRGGSGLSRRVARIRIAGKGELLMTEFAEAERSQTSVLARLEKRALVCLAWQMPRWVNSDHLTVLALAALLLSGASYWVARVSPAGLPLANLCLAINWFGGS